MEFPPFEPPRWLRNPHLQTLVAAGKPRAWNYGWKSWEPIEIDLGKDGKIVAEASWQPGRRTDSPALVLLHGLEGSARSHYLVGISRKAFEAGFHTIRANLRDCGGTEHLSPTLYCAGMSQDVLAVTNALRGRFEVRSVFAAGISLGANILLKFLGEHGGAAARHIEAAAVISAPIDLALGARTIGALRNRFYETYFIRTMIARVMRKAALYPGIFDVDRVRRVRSIYEFDDLVTAPHFGFGTADNYYRRASSGPLLREIRVPVLLVQSMDDPLIPFESFRNFAVDKNPHLTLLATEHGGHAGFLASRPAVRGDRDCHWAECRVVQFLRAFAF